METVASPKGLPSLVTALRHHIAALLSVVVVFVGSAVAYVLTTAPVYSASAVLLLAPSPGNPLSPEETSSTTRLTVAMETERGLLTTPAIAELTSQALGREAPGTSERLQVVVPGGTQMLRVSFTSTSGERAREGAQAFAETYLQYREGRTQGHQMSQQERLAAQAESVEENLRLAVADAGADGEGSYAERSVEIYTERLAQLNADISAAELENTDPGRVITPAETPTSPVGINPIFILIAAAMGGLVLGVLLTLFLEWRRDLVRDEDQFDVSGVPVFARLPRRATPGLVGSGNADSTTHEAYRRLRAGVVANGPRPHVLGVAAVGEHEHASAVVANLATVLSEAHFTVLLVAADPRTRDVETLFGIPESPGLSEVLQRELDPTEALRSVGGIALLPGGADPFGARELYAGQAFRDVVDRFRSEYDYVLIAAAGTGTADGDSAIAAADSVLLSVTTSRTTHAEVTAALDRFDRLKIHTLGAVNVPPAPAGGRRAAHTTRREASPTADAREGSRAGAS